MASNCSNTMKFIMLIGKLKTTARTGWVLRDVRNAESVADHMYRMAALSFLVDKNTGLNKDRCIKLSLVHDMAECIVGDLAPADGVSKDEKHKREKSAMEHLRSLVDEDTGQELYTLWQEYEDQTSEEAKFVKDLDKFEMIMQAFEYEKAENRPGDLQDFYNSTKGKFQTPLVKQWTEELHKLRAEYLVTSSSQHTNVDKKAKDKEES